MLKKASFGMGSDKKNKAFEKLRDTHGIAPFDGNDFEFRYF